MLCKKLTLLLSLLAAGTFAQFTDQSSPNENIQSPPNENIQSPSLEINLHQFQELVVKVLSRLGFESIISPQTIRQVAEEVLRQWRQSTSHSTSQEDGLQPVPSFPFTDEPPKPDPSEPGNNIANENDNLKPLNNSEHENTDTTTAWTDELPVMDTTTPKGMVVSTAGQAGPVVSKTEICALPAETGSCRGYFQKYYFDQQQGVCRRFTFGGCGGNLNQFRTENECMEFCRPSV